MPAARRLEPGARTRAIVENVRPQVDGGRFPIKRTVGEAVRVFADAFADGHDLIAVMLRDRPAGSECWRETPMRQVIPNSAEWTAGFVVDRQGWHEYIVMAWVDRFETWRRELRVKAEAGQDLESELLEGGALVREAASRADQVGAYRVDAAWLVHRSSQIRDRTSTQSARVELALDHDLAFRMRQYAERHDAAASEPLKIWVDRTRARTGAWYEMFPRSAGPDATRSGTFREAAERLPDIAHLGFDIVYLPPIHPIGESFRKGPNNSLAAGPGDPGSPWAIGSRAGGHTAVDPGLGTISDFDSFRSEAERLGLEIALDLAWQCSPDHPWVTEHPEWFRHRPDGTIKYAENPPKKYQDIYPLDFACDDWRNLWQALLDVVKFWMSHGVRVFRVDNPHTKTFGFWEWMIDEVHREDPGVILLSEAFTNLQSMRYLAKAGFTQSYTYFTWKNSKAELVDYLTELTATDVREYFRPNFFTNTPDILHAYLQEGGPPAFQARLLLAATLGASYGIYSGFELCEGRAVPGTEEYADSEKYQYRKWDWDRPGHIKDLVARVNAIRRQYPAFQYDTTLRFHGTDNSELIAYSKTAPYLSMPILLVVVCLNTRQTQHGHVQVPLDRLGRRSDESYVVTDLLTGEEFVWRGEWNYVRFDPGIRQGHILRIGASR
ncbi:MAG: alpha-1,4-glucan--maltose-1-phosphate maltosyltransferase [Vicinamibacterales bacterium]